MIHAIQTQSIEICFCFVMGILHDFLVVFLTIKDASKLLGLIRELSEPIKDSRHGVLLMYTLERPDIDPVELFLVIKESDLFAIAICLEQHLVRAEKLGVDYCTKPSPCGIELF